MQKERLVITTTKNAEISPVHDSLAVAKTQKKDEKSN